MSALREVKAELRQFMKKLLDKVPLEETKYQSEAVSRKVIDSEWFRESKRLSVYVSTTGEIQTDSIIKSALEMGKEVFIPQFTKGSTEMQMVRVPDQESFDSLPSTLWGIRQPKPEWKWESYHITGPLDLILAPGVAFSPSFLRCGHGKGYYDRFFATHQVNFPSSSPMKIGLALRQQIVQTIPVSDTDVLLDNVVYEGEPILSS